MTRPPKQMVLPLGHEDAIEDQSTTSAADGSIGDEDSLDQRRVQGGITTSDLVFSAYVSGNAEVFARILELHVPIGSTVADVTWGKGTFWRNAQVTDYKLLASDIQTGVDCRTLPYEAMSVDCVVLDPP